VSCCTICGENCWCACCTVEPPLDLVSVYLAVLGVLAKGAVTRDMLASNITEELLNLGYLSGHGGDDE
jgi:hypothetical protein